MNVLERRCAWGLSSSVTLRWRYVQLRPNSCPLDLLVVGDRWCRRLDRFRPSAITSIVVSMLFTARWALATLLIEAVAQAFSVAMTELHGRCWWWNACRANTDRTVSVRRRWLIALSLSSLIVGSSRRFNYTVLSLGVYSSTGKYVMSSYGNGRSSFIAAGRSIIRCGGWTDVPTSRGVILIVTVSESVWWT